MCVHSNEIMHLILFKQDKKNYKKPPKNNEAYSYTVKKNIDGLT